MAPDPYKYFRIEAHELVEQLAQAALAAESSADASPTIGKMLRLAHTLKGAARVVRLVEIAERAHAIEDVLAPARGVEAGLERDKVDALLALLDEIRTRLTAIAQVAAPAPAATPTPASPPAALARSASGPAALPGRRSPEPLLARHDTPRPPTPPEGSPAITGALDDDARATPRAPATIAPAAAAAVPADPSTAPGGPSDAPGAPSTAQGAPSTAPGAPMPAGPSTAPGAPEPSAAGPSERHEGHEIDELLDGVGESQAHLVSLRESAAAIERARRLLRTLAGHLDAPRGRDHLAADRALDRARALAAELDAELSLVDRGASRGHEQLDRELRRLRDGAEQLRLTPARALFHAVERTVRNDARAQDKRVRFEARGGAVRLEAAVVAQVQEALVQMARNAVVHGVEPAAERLAQGKPAEARVTLVVERRDQRVSFALTDDGRGVDLPAVRAALRGRARPDAVAAIDALDASGLLRTLVGSGVSTAAAVSELSGRGVGLDIVGDVAARLLGTAAVRTEPGRGTTVELVVPMTLAAIEALLVVAGGITVALPLESVRRAARYGADEVARTPEGDRVLLDGAAIPFAPLAGLLDRADERPPDATWTAVIVEAPGGVVAVGIDRALSAARVVVRALPELAAARAVVAGASLDGAGDPQLVLDADALVAEVQRGRSAEPTPAGQRTPVLVIDDSLTTRMLEQSILEAAGYEVDLATSGEEGLEMARQRRYALFLVDVEMPGMDGFTFVERTRADPELRDTPAILVTSRNAPEDLQRGQQAGALDYMVKSEFDQNRLLSRIRELVR